jgi:hypothetical protein
VMGVNPVFCVAPAALYSKFQNIAPAAIVQRVAPAALYSKFQNNNIAPAATAALHDVNEDAALHSKFQNKRNRTLILNTK